MRPEAKSRSDRAGCLTEKQDPDLAVTLDSSAMSVRAALTELRSKLGAFSLCPEVAGAVELVLAEVLNNISKHAYGSSPGRIELSVWIDDHMLVFRTSDRGAPMPQGRLPQGGPISTGRRLDQLPEGGFGWNLIRQLTADLAYSRVQDRNELTFRMRRDAQPANGV